MDLTRRDFLKGMLVAGAGTTLALDLWAFEPIDVANPLGAYQRRDWEKLYRDQYRHSIARSPG